MVSIKWYLFIVLGRLKSECVVWEWEKEIQYWPPIVERPVFKNPLH